MGNIGAHMERDISVIGDVNPNEAAALTNLIEMLIEDWDLARHKRKDRLAQVKQIGDSKDAARGRWRSMTGRRSPFVTRDIIRADFEPPRKPPASPEALRAPVQHGGSQHRPSARQRALPPPPPEDATRDAR